VVTLSLTLTFMFLFMRVIYVSLPIGVEPFARISVWIMKLLGVA
jgi:putative tricarboxylic transport membrane protein